MNTVLITGANRGLGLEFAAQYAADGWQVLAACRDPAGAGALAKLAQSANRRLSVIRLDVTDGASVLHAAERLGGQPIDLLINCAGIAGAPGQSVGHVDYQNWLRVLEVNTLGPMRLIEAFTEHVGRSRLKSIVTITSGMGSITDNTSGGSIAYRSSKAAVNMAVKCAAIELASRNIICIVINPGWVRTDMGGAHATLSPGQSVTAMRKVFDSIGLEDTGQFFNYDGRFFPW